MNGLLYSFDYFVSEMVDVVMSGDVVFNVDRDIFNEYSNVLDWFVVEGFVMGGELKGVGDFVVEVVGVEGFIIRNFDGFGNSFFVSGKGFGEELVFGCVDENVWVCVFGVERDDVIYGVFLDGGVVGFFVFVKGGLKFFG